MSFIDRMLGMQKPKKKVKRYRHELVMSTPNKRMARKKAKSMNQSVLVTKKDGMYEVYKR